MIDGETRDGDAAVQMHEGVQMCAWDRRRCVCTNEDASGGQAWVKMHEQWIQGAPSLAWVPMDQGGPFTLAWVPMDQGGPFTLVWGA